MVALTRTTWPRPRRVPAIAFDIVGSQTQPPEIIEARQHAIDEFAAHALQKYGRDSLHFVWTGDGGYLLFLDRRWRGALLHEVRRLRQWSAHESIPLRVAVHVGTVRLVQGETTTRQPGDLLNTIEGILSRTSAAGIVASDEFVRALRLRAGVEFHDERLLRLKHGRSQLLHLMSLAGIAPRSQWADPIEEDRRLLLAAVEDGRGFDAVYHAKHLLQVNSEDHVVTWALAKLGPLAFRYQTAAGEERLNEVLGHLSPANLRRLIAAGELVERKYNQLLCRRGDPGRTMFIILRGQVGVYNADPSGAVRPPATHSEGEIVGELAFALNRPRTADLVCLGDTALLAFENEHVEGLLKGRGETYRELMNGRALEHVSQRVQYMVGRPFDMLLDDERNEWIGHLATLQQNCDIIRCRPHKPITLAGLRRAHRNTAAGGIYLLASGHLRSQSTPDKTLEDSEFPLLYVDLPDLVVAPDHEYVADHGPAKILFIRKDSINELPAPVHARLIDELKRSMHSLFHYDVFLSHSFDDAVTVERWEQELAGRGLRVFRDSPERLAQHYVEKDGRALLDSLATLVFASPHVTPSSLVVQEVRFRERHFGRNPLIVPIQMPGGDPRSLGICYSMARTDRGDGPALAAVADLVRAIRSGDELPPYGLLRQAGTAIT